MFVPRKLQKRTHPGRKVHSGSDSSSVDHIDGSRISDTRQCVARITGSDAPSPPPASLPTQETASSNFTSAEAVELEAQTAFGSLAEAGKLERLVEFLFLRLSPLSLALAAFQEMDRPHEHAYSDLIANITSTLAPSQCRNSSPTLEAAEKPSRIHLARLLHLLPGLASRSKSISRLSEALHLVQQGPAAGWFALHRADFHLEWSPAYIALTQRLQGLAEPTLHGALGPLLVYVESIPPRIQTRSQAASYLSALVRQLADSTHSAAVFSVLEPRLIDTKLTAVAPRTLPAAVLEERWISGRAFFLLDSPLRVAALCDKFPWHLDRHVAALVPSKGPQEPIRCLSWTGWLELKELYLKHRQGIECRITAEDAERSASTI